MADKDKNLKQSQVSILAGWVKYVSTRAWLGHKNKSEGLDTTVQIQR
jgi:hypothetical protein